MSGYTLISQAFGEGANLYTDVLGFPPTSSSSTHFSSLAPSQLRKAYYKRALEFHPDKQSTTSTEQELETAKLKFQAVSLAYAILSNPEQRREYDESGYVGDDDSSHDFGSFGQGYDMWTEYFRGIFGTVTTRDIDQFTLKYKCSEEEQKDVLKYYIQFKGNLKKMLECVMCSSEIDMKRWVEDYITPAIRDKSVPDFMETIRKTLVIVKHNKEDVEEKGMMEEEKDKDDEDDDSQRTETEEEEDDDDDDDMVDHRKVSAKVTGGGKPKAKTVIKKKSPAKKPRSKQSETPSMDLIAAIQGKSVARRKDAFGNLMSGLEARYGGGGNTKGKKSSRKQVEDIPDDEFEAIRSKLGSRKR